jgi:hypothetical protein
LCDDVPDRTAIISKGFEQAEEEWLIQFLRNNQDVFAWSSADLKGVSSYIMEHVLNADPKFKLVRQRLQTILKKGRRPRKPKSRSCVMQGVIREVQFSDWLANVVMVPKKNGKW